MSSRSKSSRDGRSDRFSRQARLSEIGEAGQARLSACRVAVLGVGALGTTSSHLLLRTGVRHLRLIDRDFVELHNLPRQTLFTEKDADAGAPKAIAAKAALEAIDSSARIDAFVRDVTVETIEELLDGVDLVIDGLDNFEGRYLLNDWAIARGIPWVYAGAVGCSGLVFPVLPGKSACLRCLFPDAPDAGTLDTCESVGVLPMAPALVATVQAAEAIKILLGDEEKVLRRGLAVEMWAGLFRQGPILDRLQDCPCCSQRRFDYLEGRAGGAAESLCGRDAVQVRPPGSSGCFRLDELVSRLPADVVTRQNEWLLRFEVDDVVITVFGDGRAILQGVSEPSRARALYARWVGS